MSIYANTNNARKKLENADIRRFKEIPPRNLHMRDERRRGATLAEIGKKHGVSTERVRQILAKVERLTRRANSQYCVALLDAFAAASFVGSAEEIDAFLKEQTL